MNIIDQTRKFIEESYHNDKAQMLHFDRTLYWLKQLKPDADDALSISALGHDIERAFRDEKLGFTNSDKSFINTKWLEYHSNEGARILGEFLTGQGVNSSLVDRVKHLISKHEVGGDDDQNLLKDADSLSFVENNAPIFLSKIDKLGFDRVKEKFDWMYERISSAKAKDMAKPFYERMINELGKFKH